MKFLSVAVILLVITVNAKSQTAVDSIKIIVNQLFTAMKKNDSSLLISCFADSAILQTIVQNKQDRIVVKNESIKSFAKSVGSAPKGSLDERIVFDVIKTDGPLAIVWTPYSFYYNGNFSHCGVNSFQLIRTKSGWKIIYLIDTRRKMGCK